MASIENAYSKDGYKRSEFVGVCLPSKIDYY